MNNKKDPPKTFRAMALTTSILSYLVGPIIVGILVGRWLDQLLETGPYLMIVGLFLGLAGGLYGLVRLINRIMKED